MTLRETGKFKQKSLEPEISLSTSGANNTDSHKAKQGFKQINQTASDSSIQTEMRSAASSQVLFKTPSPERSTEHPAFKRTFKCQETYASLDNLKTPGQTPFQRPDTLRPKSSPESVRTYKPNL